MKPQQCQITLGRLRPCERQLAGTADSGHRTQIPLTHLSVGHASFVTCHWSLVICHGRVIWHWAEDASRQGARPPRTPVLIAFSFADSSRQGAKPLRTPVLIAFPFADSSRQGARPLRTPVLIAFSFADSSRQGARPLRTPVLIAFPFAS